MNPRLILFKSNQLDDGSHPVYLYINNNGNRTKIALTNFDLTKCRLSGKPKEWIQAPGTGSRFKKADDPRNKLLERIASRITRYKAELEVSGKPFTIPGLKRRLFHQVDNTALLGLLESQIKALKDQGRVKYAMTFEDTRNAVKRFTGERDLPLSEVDQRWLDKFNRHLAQTCSVNTRSIYVRGIRRIFNLAIKDGIIEPSLYPFGSGGFTISNEVKQRRVLTKEQIQALQQLDLPATLDESRNYFLFSYHAFGMNFKDIARLTWDNYDGNYLVFYRSKTKEASKNLRAHRIFITEFMAQVIDSFERMPGYIFPVIFSRSPATQEHQIHRKLRSINKDLKIIAAKAGIPRPDEVTYYVARHSFASILQQSGANIFLIKQALGHKDISTTQRYLAGFDQRELDMISLGL